MALLGSGFDPAVPANNAPIKDGAAAIRFVKLMLQNFVSVMFNPDTGLLKAKAVTNSMLADTGTAGVATKVTTNAQGLVTLRENPTTLAGYGITDGLSTSTVIAVNRGGLGADNSAASAGRIPIATGAGAFTLNPITSSDFTVTLGAGTIDIGYGALKPFIARATISSAAATTPVNVIVDGLVPTGKKIYLASFTAKVNGGVLWAVTSNVKLRDTNGTPTDFITFNVAALTANAVLVPGTGNVVLNDAFALGTGGTTNKGLVLVGDANGTGSDLVVSISGYYAV